MSKNMKARLSFPSSPVVTIPDSPSSAQSEDADIGFEEDPLNYTPTRPNGTIKSKRTEVEPSRSKKIRSISPHSRLLRRRRSDNDNTDGLENERPTVVAVTSCRSDAYYHQKAPGSASKLPQKAPNALKLFHELATGVKDAYEAVGSTPIRPETDEDGKPKQTANEIILWEFMGNLDFLLALVDEVAVDTATRGALKDDTTFKSIRDVIKKGNKVLENMLVRREKKYTLMFRLTTPKNNKQISKMKSWNQKVERAVGKVTDSKDGGNQAESNGNESKGSSEGGSVKGLITRGRLFGRSFPGARRATPTPTMRRLYEANGPKSMGSAADDGFFAAPAARTLEVGNLDVKSGEETPTRGTISVTPDSFVKVQSPTPPKTKDLSVPENISQAPQSQSLSETLTNHVKPAQPKDELVDVIRGLKVEKKMKDAGKGGPDPSEIKPNWKPKADIPAIVPKLPTEYIHRHRLMKQVINCLLDQPGAGPRDTDDENACYITSITSRHSDKAGNGKTTLAVAAIQSVEIRERFSDGICWIKLGRRPLSEMDIRSLYEELHRQLVCRGSDAYSDDDDDDDDESDRVSITKSWTGSQTIREEDNDSTENPIQSPFLPKSRRKFQGGELEGMKEDLYKIICKRKVLICLDDVWSVEDAHWFLFHFKNKGNVIHPNMDNQGCEFRILMTTRQPGLLGNGNAQEVYVRIFSEHEAVKLLLASAGRRPYGGRSSPVFVESRIIVKGCGNSPLAVRLAGGMLGRLKYWTNHFPIWKALLETCQLSLEEATKMRSFSKAVGLIVDLSFSTIENLQMKSILRICFVSFAMVFQTSDRLKNGKGIPKSIVLGLFNQIQKLDRGKENAASNKNDGNEAPKVTSKLLLTTLEKMHLVERAKPASFKRASEKMSSFSARSNSFDNINDAKNGDSASSQSTEKLKPMEQSTAYHEPCYLMHDSIIALADDMAQRSTPSFAPDSEEDTGSSLFTPLRSAAKYLAQLTNRGDGRRALQESQFHELMVASLTNGWVSSPNSPSLASQFLSIKSESDEVGQYTVEYLPSHLSKAKDFSTAAELLADKKFIVKRVSLLGCMNATRRHVSDLIEMKKESSKTNHAESNPPPPPPPPKSTELISSSSEALDEHSIASSKDGQTVESRSVAFSTPVKSHHKDFNSSGTIKDAIRRISDEIYRIDSGKTGSIHLSLTMAFCLSAIGEGLVRCRQTKDAMLRLEEATGVYRNILGPYHIDVARALNCVAKSLVKLGENRLALIKFGEAAKIYEACNANLHFDSISNSQSMASLLVDLRDYASAESKYEDVLELRKTVNGQMSYQVARTHNEYAAILAKQGKLDAAIYQYEEARVSLRGAASLYSSESDDFDDRFNTTVIDLNIASIKAKKGDIEGAISCYQVVVFDLQNSRNQANDSDEMRNESATYSKHIVAAMSRIGSLKLKLRDNSGALEMFEGILEELEGDNEKSSAMKLETARAHIKCATIYRQARSSTKRAITHLREALKLYMQIYGPEHRDTRALSASLRQWQHDERSSADEDDWD